MTLAYSYSESVSIFSGLVLRKGYSYTGTSENKTPVAISSLKEEELTNFCMQLTEQSLAKEWEHEDDEYWASYLND